MTRDRLKGMAIEYFPSVMIALAGLFVTLKINIGSVGLKRGLTAFVMGVIIGSILSLLKKLDTNERVSLLLILAMASALAVFT